MPVRQQETDGCTCDYSSAFCGPCEVAECHCDSEGYAYCIESGRCGSFWTKDIGGSNRKGGRVSGVQRFASGGRAGRSRLGHPIKKR